MNDHKKLFDDTRKLLTPYQHTLHYATGPKNQEDHPDNKIHAVFYGGFRKSTWYYHYPAKLECLTPRTVNAPIEYRTRPTPHHGLLYTYLITKLPLIKAKPGYEIKWCPNIGLNIIESATLCFNDNQLQYIDNIYCDNYVQTMVSKSEINAVNIGLGNVDELQNWNTVLPSYTTSFMLPWFYSLDPTSFFPLYMCGAMDRLDHNLILKRKISQLLIIRRIEDNVIIPFNSEYIIIENNNEIEIAIPEMYGEYLYLTDMECNFYRCERNLKDTINIDNVYYIDVENPSPLGKTIVVPFPEINNPVHTIYWVAENCKASKLNYYSNYTTNNDNHIQGSSPIEWTSLETSKGTIFRNLDNVYTERVHPSRHFRAVPHNNGYNAWTFGMRAHDPDPKPGFNVTGGKLIIKLKDKDTESREYVYKIKIRLIFTYQLKFKTWPQTEEERLIKNAIIEIL